jgi:hypothetical protein
MASPVSFRRKLGNDTIYSSLPHINIQRLKENNSVQKSSSLNCVKTDPFEIPVKNGLHHKMKRVKPFLRLSFLEFLLLAQMSFLGMKLV